MIQFSDINDLDIQISKIVLEAPEDLKEFEKYGEIMNLYMELIDKFT